MSDREEVKLLKEELHAAEEAFRRRDQLAEQRGQVESSLETMVEESESKTLKLHQTRKTPEDLEKELQQDKRFIENLKRKKQEIDHQLDLIDDDVEARIEELKGSLVQTVLELNPSAQHQHQDLKDKLEKSLALESELRGIHSRLTTIHQHLEAAIATRRRRRGPLAFIFAKNPLVVVSQHLEETAKTCGEVLPELARFSDGPFDTLSQFLELLKAECEKPWGFRQFSTIFPEASSKTRAFIRQIEKKLEQLESEALSLESDMATWIDEHSS